MEAAVALIIGVIFGSWDPAVLTILNDAFGFVGAPGPAPTHWPPAGGVDLGDRAGRTWRKLGLEPHRPRRLIGVV